MRSHITQKPNGGPQQIVTTRRLVSMGFSRGLAVTEVLSGDMTTGSVNTLDIPTSQPEPTDNKASD